MEDQLHLFEEIKQSSNSSTPIESNRRFCKDLEEALLDLGFVENTSNALELGMFNKRSPYKDMYGTTRQSPFILNTQKHGLVRVEAHRQESSGSVDQKFPFFFTSLMKSPEKNIVIVFDGSGYKREAFDWLLNETENVTDKNFKVFATKESFLNWLVE